MNKIILSIALSLTLLNASSIEVLKNGSTYKINESNIIQLFKEHVEAKSFSGSKMIPA